MGNRPRQNYDYTRPGVAMLTLKARRGVRLCRITPETFALTDTGRRVQNALLGIPAFYAQIKLGQYQIMPDHLHVMMHVTRFLPAGVTLQRVIRGFKIGLNRDCRQATGSSSFQVFEKGMHDRLVFDRDHLEREVAYIRDNVRRYRLLLANPNLFRQCRRLLTLPDGIGLWGIGNTFLLQHPRRVRVQFSRRMTEAEWFPIHADLLDYLDQGYVFVSPFLSPFEKRVLNEVISQGGRAIRLTHQFFGPRYKPGGALFDLCCAGRLLDVSVAGEFERYARLSREACLRLNEVAEIIATTKWSQWGG